MGLGSALKSVAGALTGGGLELITGTGAVASDLIGGMEANRMNMHMASDARDFSKMMSDTAHQREVKDLLAAGLNPILSAGGTGASTPAASMGHVENAAKGLSDSIRQYALVSSQLKNINADTAQKDSQSDLNDANRDVAETNRLIGQKTLEKMGVDITKGIADIDFTRANTSAVQYENTKRALESLMYEKYPEIFYTEKAKDFLGDIMKMFKPGVTINRNENFKVDPSTGEIPGYRRRPWDR